MARLHGELAAALRSRTQVRRVAEHLRQRDKAVDLLRAIALRQALHAFLAKERERSTLVLIMTAAAALAVGMMESTTLGAMTPINLVFMFSLAQLAGMSRESVSC